MELSKPKFKKALKAHTCLKIPKTFKTKLKRRNILQKFIQKHLCWSLFLKLYQKRDSIKLFYIALLKSFYKALLKELRSYNGKLFLCQPQKQTETQPTF